MHFPRETPDTKCTHLKIKLSIQTVSIGHYIKYGPSRLQRAPQTLLETFKSIISLS